MSLIAENISVNGVKSQWFLYLFSLILSSIFLVVRTPPNRSDGTNCTKKNEEKTKLVISSCTNKTNGKGIVKHLPKFAQNQ
jgi:hypothetical protein